MRNVQTRETITDSQASNWARLSSVRLGQLLAADARSSIQRTPQGLENHFGHVTTRQMGKHATGKDVNKQTVFQLT